MKKLTIVAAQINLLVGDIEGNADRIIEATNTACKKHKADLVVFPELAITGYPPEDLLFRPGLYKRTNVALQKIADNTKNTTIVIGFPGKDDDGERHNMAAVIQNHQIVAKYAKQELPNYTVFDEKRYFSPGHEPCIFTVKGIKLGVLICEDLWFQKAIRETTQAGADIIVCINASPFAQDKAHERRDLLKKRSLEVKKPIVYLNLVGGQDELVFDGGSMVYDAKGNRVQEAPYCKEDLMVIQFSLDKHDILTKHALPPEPFEEEKIYRTLVLGIKDYINKNHFPGAIVGLSGGIDSALTLAIAVDAIGADRVEAVFMPSRFTSKMSREDSTAEAKALNIKYSIIDIDPMFEAFLKGLSKEFENLPVDTTEENIQARIRATILMAISNKKNYIVLSTGNKSETAVGYTTLYGDMVGGFAVIKDVYKTMVYRLARYRNTISSVIPDRVLERPPSAELAEDQQDQDSLPPYPILDEILERYITKDEDPTSIVAAGFNIDTVKRVVKSINQNEYKRRQGPIGLRITERAFGKDRRYPITSGYTRSYLTDS